MQSCKQHSANDEAVYLQYVVVLRDGGTPAFEACFACWSGCIPTLRQATVRCEGGITASVCYAAKPFVLRIA